MPLAITPWINSLVVLVIAIAALLFLFKRSLYNSPMWHAMLTPLASIIGSGFLICAPLLAIIAGIWAPLIMLGITAVAYGLGSNIRYNIQHIEPMTRTKSGLLSLQYAERLSSLCLGIAYIISVAFYLKLLSIFALRGAHIHSTVLENALTTAIILVIGISGKIRGISLLELQEMYSVNFKLAIIFAFILALLFYNAAYFFNHKSIALHFTLEHKSLAQSAKQILGTLLIVQGFETSRYLGDTYTSNLRVKSMRNAQLISAGIYIIFILTSMPLMQHIQAISETLIIDLSKHVALILPLLITLAGIASQFSAAIADSIGSAGLLAETTKHKLSTNNGYILIAILVITLIWLSHIYTIITIASKAFAIYYAIQLLMSLIHLRHNKPFKAQYFALYSLLFGIMLLVVIFGIPVDSVNQA